MFSVEMTLMPASSSSSTSCQRFSLREPGTLVCASSSTSATSGRRASTASTSISSKLVPRYSIAAARHDLEVADLLRRARAAVGLDEADHHVGSASLRRRPSFSIANVLPTPGAAPR